MQTDIHIHANACMENVNFTLIKVMWSSFTRKNQRHEDMRIIDHGAFVNKIPMLYYIRRNETDLSTFRTNSLSPFIISTLTHSFARSYISTVRMPSFLSLYFLSFALRLARIYLCETHILKYSNEHADIPDLLPDLCFFGPVHKKMRVGWFYSLVQICRHICESAKKNTTTTQLTHQIWKGQCIEIDLNGEFFHRLMANS